MNIGESQPRNMEHGTIESLNKNLLQDTETTRGLGHRPECILCKIGQEKGQ